MYLILLFKKCGLNKLDWRDLHQKYLIPSNNIYESMKNIQTPSVTFYINYHAITILRKLSLKLFYLLNHLFLFQD